MKIEILPNAEKVARRGAAVVAEAARSAVEARGKFVFAVSGGSTPWQMLRFLANEDLPWNEVHIVQVDERVAPDGHADRNLTHLMEALAPQTKLPRQNIHAMPVTKPDLSAGSAEYADGTLRALCGSPAVIDLVHLGLGGDGHTASLVPGDWVLKVTDRDVSPTSGDYQGRRRMTLTYPAINRARQILWLVTGASKAEMVSRMVDGDAGIPAGRIRQSEAILLADEEAAAHLDNRQQGADPQED
jgi:6-phosphogluconolactonase